MTKRDELLFDLEKADLDIKRVDLTIKEAQRDLLRSQIKQTDVQTLALEAETKRKCQKGGHNRNNVKGRKGRKGNERYNTYRILEDLQDRAANNGCPCDMTLTQFTDYLRSLYPEYYTK